MVREGSGQTRAESAASRKSLGALGFLLASDQLKLFFGLGFATQDPAQGMRCPRLLHTGSDGTASKELVFNISSGCVHATHTSQNMGCGQRGNLQSLGGKGGGNRSEKLW